MLNRLLLITFIIIIAYLIIFMRNLSTELQTEPLQEVETKTEQEVYKIQNFEFTKFNESGERELELQGDSADMLAEVVELENVIAKAYTDKVPITITANYGEFNKATTIMSLLEDVVATAENGARLLTDQLDILIEENLIKTDKLAKVFKDSMILVGIGAQANQEIEMVHFWKEITVTFENDGKNTIIKCQGPLAIDYTKNEAEFFNDVVVRDLNGIIRSDRMKVYYSEADRQVEKIFASGNVVIERGEDKTYSDQVVYFSQEDRVILDGDPEAFGMPGGAEFKTENYWEEKEDEIPA